MKYYDVIFCNPNKQNYVLDEKTLRNFSGTILTASTGLNHIDIDYAIKKKIDVLTSSASKCLEMFVRDA